MRKKFPINLLIDTWWFSLTSRMSDQQFVRLAKLRKKQQFTGIQLVVGIPPEVGPEHESAASEKGAAWNLKGEINYAYLDFAFERIKFLHTQGFTIIVYGAWGHEIEWIGVEKMKVWWKALIKKCDSLRVIYCVSGESNLWIGEEKRLLPNKSTDNLQVNRYVRYVKYILGIKQLVSEKQKKARKEKWSEVLRFIATLTSKPLIIHVLPNEFSFEVVENPELLSAVTVHTSHHASSRPKYWQTVIEAKGKYPDLPFINLEPWYEGIRDQFYTEDQLFAFWVSRMSGADGACYGAHGIWNAGDGEFLGHWGKQTLDAAMKLATPELLGLSNAFFIEHAQKITQPIIEEKNGELISIKNGNFLYVPKIENYREKIAYKRIFNPTVGTLVNEKPEMSAVVFVI